MTNTIDDNNPYQAANISLFESIYGKNLISLGGLPAIDNMFSDLKITNMTALDLGFGLGGVAFYLAEKYSMTVAGIEVQAWMVEHAKQQTPEQLATAVSFDTYINGKLPYPPETFDLVYSKGVLNHVRNKIALFEQIHTVLKPQGLFVIADWIFKNTETQHSDFLVRETQDSYRQVLMQAGFDKIRFRDDSKLFLDYAQRLLSKLDSNKKFITGHYGQQCYTEIQKQHENLIEEMTQERKMATRIVASKASC